MAVVSAERKYLFWIAGCCLAVILSLYIVGLKSGTIVRHIV